MIYKTSSVGTYSSAHDRTQSSILSFIRDSALFAWLVINFTAVSFLFLNGGNADSPDLSMEGSLFWQIVIPIFLGIGILLQIFGQTTIRRLIVVAAPLMPMMIWIILSVTWADFPDFSIRRAVRFELETIALILFAASYGDQYKFLRIICLSFAFILVLDVVFLSMPDISFTPIGYAGVHYHKNNTGMFCLLALPVFLLAAIDRRIFPSRIVSFALVPCCLGIFAISLSKTSLALAPVCVILTVGFISLRRASSVTAFVVTLIGALSGALTTAIIILVGVDKLLINTVGDLTFTGRDRIWQYALSLFWQSPIGGRGFGSLWNVGIDSVLQQEILGVGFIIKEGHNGYIDIITELGIVGLLLTIGFIAVMFYQSWVRISYASVKRINFIAIYMLFAIVLVNMTESTIFRSGNEFWLYFLLVTYASIFIATKSPTEMNHLNGYSGDQGRGLKAMTAMTAAAAAPLRAIRGSYVLSDVRRLVPAALIAAPLLPLAQNAAAQTAQLAAPAKTDATTAAKTKKAPSDAQLAARERQKKCGAEWKEAKAAGKVETGMTWPKYWSACNKRLKAGSDQSRLRFEGDG